MSVTLEAQPMRGQVAPHPREKREKARALYLDGKALVDVAYEMQLPAATIRAWASRENWDAQKQIAIAVPALDAESRATVARQIVVSNESPELSDLDLAEKQDRYSKAMGDVAVRVADYVASLDADKVLAAADKIAKMDGTNRKALRLVESEKATTIVQIALLGQTHDKQPRLVSPLSAEQPILEA